jgi:hypothetical protein
VTRNILAHVPKTDATSALPSESFDGVALRVQVKDAATAISITADGKEVFNGTMLPGTSQTFKGSNEINLSTSNAGATTLVITNQVVASQDLGAVGSGGQAKNNLEFHKDTKFQ